MAEETRTWTILGRRLTVQAPPKTIALLESLLAEISQQATHFRKTHPYADELTHWLMATLSVLEALSQRLHLYEDFCQRIEALLPPAFLSDEV
ncbi:MAG: cell division protein ZapA [Bacteroidia bacterium]|nr:cell division protein ZapA [Bacteroidia bacterium]MCX7763733.1 cell division protein ZapA [Bacteroidia bacterium]MDW8058212.1 cell division protein ZapA [Bacteroidia bacterium]